MNNLTMGSLFDGIGGFVHAGNQVGIDTLWSSEIDPCCEAVTKHHFPEVVQHGDITKINGAKVDRVDIICGGSPCQDLSVAGKRAGLAGERSGLYMEQIRIIREMRAATNNTYPRYMVWENVPGALSSNKGEDFRAVLEEAARCANPEISIPEPEIKNGKLVWKNAGCIVGNGWSIAWRILDAQFWGVPQRRRRIFLVADFGSERAGEVLFKQEGLRGDSAESGEARERIATDAKRSIGGSGYGGVVAWTYRGRENGCNIEYQTDVAYALRNPVGGGSQANICYPVSDAKGNVEGSVCGFDGYNSMLTGEKSATIGINCGTSTGRNGVVESVFNESGQGYWMPDFGCLRAEGENRPTRPGHCVVREVKCLNPNDPQTMRVYDADGLFPALTSNSNGGQNRQAICLQANGIDRKDENGCNGRGWNEDISYTLNTIDRHAVVFEEKGTVYALDQQGGKGQCNYAENVMVPLCADSHGTPHAVVFTQNQRDEVRDLKGVAASLAAESGMHQTNYVCEPIYPKVCGTIAASGAGTSRPAGQCNETDLCIVYGVDCRNATVDPELTHTLQAHSAGGTSLNCTPSIVQKLASGADATGTLMACHAQKQWIGNQEAFSGNYHIVASGKNRKYIIRRLTPLECDRLQGYPEVLGITTNMTKDEYIAFNLACGHIIADTESGKIYGTRGPGGKLLEFPVELTGTLVNGYKVVSIRNGETKLQCRVNRIIWISKHGVPEEDRCVDHINNDKTDNRLCNLQLLTFAENSTKAKNDGLYRCGEDNPRSKITQEIADAIRADYIDGKTTIRILAEKYNISKSRIGQIINMQGWTQIPYKGKPMSDSARYRMDGNSVAIPCVVRVLGGIAAQTQDIVSA